MNVWKHKFIAQNYGIISKYLLFVKWAATLYLVKIV